MCGRTAGNPARAAAAARRYERPSPAPPTETAAMFINHYDCPRRGCHWTDTWSCQVDDDCPACGLRHIAPSDSEDAVAAEPDED